MRLLIAEDDEMLADGLGEVFSSAGFAVDQVATGPRALAAARDGQYDLAVVDLGLPGLDGMEVIRRLRALGRQMPVLILTARDELGDRVRGLNEGADDYLVKPFEIPELVARVNALIRRGHARGQTRSRLGLLEMDLTTQEATVDGRPLDLPARERAVLQLLMSAAPRVVPKARLVNSLSDWDREVSPNAVEIYVSRLRSRLAGSRVDIRTVRGIGYRLEEIEGDVPPS